MMLMPSSYYAAAIVILSWMTESITQPAPKRAAAMAFINALCVSLGTDLATRCREDSFPTS